MITPIPRPDTARGGKNIHSCQHQWTYEQTHLDHEALQLQHPIVQLEIDYAQMCQSVRW